MKVVFLDIDGVLNPRQHMNDLYVGWKKGVAVSRDEFGHLFCPSCVEYFENLLFQTGAKIVISSTWRRSGLQVMKDLWKVRGLEGEVVDITPSLNTPRGEEIAEWLRLNDVDKYVIIDDNSDMLPEQMSHFVKCENKWGFTKECLEKALKILT